MTKSIQPRIIIIAGPTASGKSGLALSIAEKTGGVIVNADSRQIYRELPILTARPSMEEESRVPHRLYGSISLGEAFSVGAWLNLARMEIDWALAQHITPIIVGGTGLYLKALLHGIADIPQVPPDIRTQAAGDYEAMGKAAFTERLRAVDPEFFQRLKVVDRQRLTRAYEVWLATGKSLSWWQKQGAAPPYPRAAFDLYRLVLPRDELYRRCDARFARMVAQGAVEEVKRMWSGGDVGMGKDKNPIAPHPPIPSSPHGIIGVKEITAYLNGENLLEQAISAAQQATRNYAKRQETWFRHQMKEATPLSAGELSKKFHN